MPAPEIVELRLAYRPPYSLAALLDFLRPRALPGIERVDEGGYARVLGPAHAPGWLRVGPWPAGGEALRLEVRGRKPVEVEPIVPRVRRMFDLDADPGAILPVLAADPALRPLVEREPGLRLPGGWDGFEIAVRAVLGQQVSVAAASTLAARLVERHGHRLESPPAPGLERLFPGPERLAHADLGGLGLTGKRAGTVREVARAFLDGRVDFRPERALEEHVARWSALPGIGPWTAHYVAIRALGHADAFPVGDLVLRRAAADPGSPPVGARELAARAERWRPWRAYAAIHLWRAATLGAPKRA